MKDMFERLRRPFPESSIEFVVTWSYGDNYEDVMIGVAPYIKRESVIVRLDHVVGPENWRNEISPQPYGLYNGISIKRGLDWVTKWDGSEMGKTGGQIDAVKSVSTKSLRRAAEVWGVGLYLKDLPQLFAYKRPADEYDADEKTKINREDANRKKYSFTVRWDHPIIPKEFLPRYMTPEQYYSLSGLTKYFNDKQAKPVKEMLDAWSDDEDSVAYAEASQKIRDITQFIENNINYHNPKDVHTGPLVRASAPAKNKKDKEKPKDPAPAESKQEPESNKEPEETKIIETTKEQYAEKFRNLRSLLEELIALPFEDENWTKTSMKGDLQLLKKAADDKKPIPEREIEKLLSSYSRAAVDLMPEEDDDLPF